MDLQDCLKKSMIGWLIDKIDNNKKCYFYPRYIQDEDGSWDTIPPDLFPNLGALEVVLAAESYDADEIIEKFGSLVNATLTDIPIENAIKINNTYKILYNHNYNENSKIVIKKFDSSYFIQVISCDKNYEELNKDRNIVATGETIYTNEVLVRCKDCYCGPFISNPTGGNISLSGSSLHGHRIGIYDYRDIDSLVLSIEDHFDKTRAKFIVRDIELLKSKERETYDWISDEILASTLIRLLRKSASHEYTIKDTQKIKDTLIETLNENKENEITDERLQRILIMLDDVDKHKQLLQEIAFKVLEIPKLQNKIGEIIVNNHFSLIEDKLGEVEAVRNKIDELKRIIEDLESKKASAELELSDKEASLKQKSLSEELENAQKELSDLKKEIGDFGIAFDTIKDLNREREALQVELNLIKHDVDKAKLEQNDVKKAFEKILQEFKDKTWLAQNLIDKVLLEQILATVEGRNLDIDEEPASFDVSLLKQEFDSEDIIDTLLDYVSKKSNRDFTRNDIINLLICITQGFVTTFAGEPGTGKTSLCHILAKALGLSRGDSNNRFIEIPVERGWTSHKDFIGYFNPLTNKPEKSNSDVYNALKMLDMEKEATDAAPFIFLLDEANLSQIEHYWSVFLRICDEDSFAKANISLGGNINWNIPKHIRFLATVNFDHTTEDLSPRFLDRSWVITLSADRISDDSINENLVTNEFIYDFNVISKYFCPSDTDEMDDFIKDKWNAIQKIFKDENHPISQRNSKMVINYCLVAFRLMETKTSDTRLAPLDYAISQKILPTINGMGDSYKNIIEKLLILCETGMPLTYKHLRKMERTADMGYYQFFAR